MKANLLKAEMIKNGVSVAMLAKEIGVSEKTVYRKISGKDQFKLDEVVKIINFLGIQNPSDIFFH